MIWKNLNPSLEPLRLRLRPWITLLALPAFLLNCGRWFGGAAGIDAVYYTVNFYRHPLSWRWSLAAAATVLLLLWKLRRMTRWGIPLLPALLFWPLWFLPQNFACLALSLALFGWVLYRVLATENLRWHRHPLPARYAMPIALLLGAIGAYWSFRLQCHAYDSFFFACKDWGEYAESYLRLADGGMPWKTWLMQAGHFNLLPNGVMSFLLYFFRAPETIFAVSALLTGSIPPLLYLLARARRLSCAYALGCAALGLFNPVIVNQSLSLFYGYHPILFSGPLILLFFLFREKQNRAGMAAMLILSLLVQETVAVFWGGYALYCLLERKWKAGFALGCGALLWFFLLTAVVMRYASGAAGYAQNFHYTNLGTSFGELLLSPVFAPKAFWGNLLQWPCAGFLFTLFLPVGGLIFLRKREVVIALPLLFGVLLQQSPDLKNPVMQYGYETTVLLLAASVPSLIEKSAKMCKKLRCGLAVSLTLTIAGGLFYARYPVGKYSAQPVLARADRAAVLDFLAPQIPGTGRLITTGRLRSHYFFERSVLPLTEPYRVGDTVILDLDETLEPVGILHRKLILDPQAMATASQNFFGHQYAVWRILAPGSVKPLPPFLLRVPEKQFAAMGVLLEQDDPAFSVRLARSPSNHPVLLVRLLKRPEYDVRIVLTPERGEPRTELVRYGYGVHPAWNGTPGEVFAVELPIAMPRTPEVQLIRCN